jgi:hypothetical protein
MSFPLEKINSGIDYAILQDRKQCKVFFDWVEKQPKDDIVPYDVYSEWHDCNRRSWIKTSAEKNSRTIMDTMVGDVRPKITKDEYRPGRRFRDIQKWHE